MVARAVRTQDVPARRGLESALSRWKLRSADSVGVGAQVSGRPCILNQGSIEIGTQFRLSSRPAQSHLAALSGGAINIGNRVHISYGAAVAALKRVTIGDDVRIGPFVVIMDGDFHDIYDRDAPGEMSPVTIGPNVLVGARVTILRGSVIGAGAQLRSGCVVSGPIASGSIVAGVPARPISAARNAGDTDIASFVAKVLGLATPPGPDDGPDEIAAWDSLGALRLLLEVEDAFDVSLGEREFKEIRSVSGLGASIARARAAAP
jgi:acetyltransferase-like isoleucine patch superfamily enzyme/acyl carrier protein